MGARNRRRAGAGHRRARWPRGYGLEYFRRAVPARSARDGAAGADRPSAARRRAAEDSVSVDDCASGQPRFERRLSTSRTIVPDGATLEVSSPGLDRRLRGRGDYRRFVGRLAKIVMRESKWTARGFSGGGSPASRETARDHAIAATERDGIAHRVPHGGHHAERIWKWNSEIMSNPLQQTIEALAKEKGIRTRRRHQRH